jgi:hypothetical protein
MPDYKTIRILEWLRYIFEKYEDIIGREQGIYLL